MHDVPDGHYELPTSNFTAAERVQLREMLEERRNRRWLWKRIGAFALGMPAILAVWQAVIKVLEWIRGP
jgi:hypothetical protein